MADALARRVSRLEESANPPARPALRVIFNPREDETIERAWARQHPDQDFPANDRLLIVRWMTSAAKETEHG